MPLQKKLLPRPSFSLVLHPEGDRDYRHFEGAGEVPFDNGAATMSRANAWWLADSSLLAYWDQAEAGKRFADAAGLRSRLIEGKKKDTQCYLAWNDALAIVAFRGTQADSLQDLITDAAIPVGTWDQLPGELVHSGFLEALDAVWQDIAQAEELKHRRVWFTGHSLGAALATLGGDRFARERSGLGLANSVGFTLSDRR